MMYHRTNAVRGFSLVEMMVYLAILVTVSTAAVLLLLSFDDLLAEHRANQQLTRNATAVMERLLYDIRLAESVNNGASTLGSSPGVLVLAQGAETTTYSVSSGALMVSVNGALLGPLTDGEVAVTDLFFYAYDNAVTEAVRVELTLSAIFGDTTVTETYRNTAVLLESYE